MKKRNNILIVDDDINTSLQYKKWLEDEGGFNLTLINDPEIAEVNFKLQNYDLVLISFRMSIVDGFDLFYHKLLEISKNIEDTPSKRFRGIKYYLCSNCCNTDPIISYLSELSLSTILHHIVEEILNILP